MYAIPTASPIILTFMLHYNLITERQFIEDFDRIMVTTHTRIHFKQENYLHIFGAIKQALSKLALLLKGLPTLKLPSGSHNQNPSKRSFPASVKLS